MISADDFLKVVNPDRYGDKTASPSFRLGTIPNDHSSGDPRIILDGESEAANITYKCVSYTPVAGERVLLGRVGSSWVVLGGIGAAGGGGGGAYNLDGGRPDTNYGGIEPIVGGGV